MSGILPRTTICDAGPSQVTFGDARRRGAGMGELHELSAIELAGAIASKEVSSREALTHFVARVDRLDGPLNAVVTRDLDEAYAAADGADAATVRGDALAPLHG